MCFASLFHSLSFHFSCCNTNLYVVGADSGIESAASLRGKLASVVKVARAVLGQGDLLGGLKACESQCLWILRGGDERARMEAAEAFSSVSLKVKEVSSEALRVVEHLKLVKEALRIKKYGDTACHIWQVLHDKGVGNFEAIEKCSEISARQLRCLKSYFERSVESEEEFFKGIRDYECFKDVSNKYKALFLDVAKLASKKVDFTSWTGIKEEISSRLTAYVNQLGTEIDTNLSALRFKVTCMLQEVDFTKINREGIDDELNLKLQEGIDKLKALDGSIFYLFLVYKKIARNSDIKDAYHIRDDIAEDMNRLFADSQFKRDFNQASCLAELPVELVLALSKVAGKFSKNGNFEITKELLQREYPLQMWMRNIKEIESKPKLEFSRVGTEMVDVLLATKRDEKEAECALDL